MKILVMTNTYTPVVGGVEESIKAFTRQFKKRGHKVLIVAPEFDNMPDNEEDVIRIPAIQRFNHSDFSVNIPIPGLLSKLVKDFKPEIVHSHHPFLIGDMALRLCGQYGIPLVFTYHTMFEHYLHYLPIQNDRIKRFVIELSTGYANMTDQVIVPNKSVHDVLLKRGVDVPMEIIPTGIDIKKFSKGDGAKIREKFHIPPNAFVIGHLGRLTKEKNLEFLSAAVARFLKQREDCHFLVVGKGPMEEEIRRAFEAEHIGQRLHLTGVLKDQDVIDGYHAMDIFAFASQSETQGLVLIEALSAGVPVVAVDATGARDTVKDKVNGRLIASQNRDDFIEALAWCRDCGKDDFSKLKEGARKEAANYSIEFCADKELKIYRSIQSMSFMLSNEKHDIWSNILNRFKTEWDMAKNLFEASEAALLNGEETDREKEETERLALDQRHDKSWTLRFRRWFNPREWGARVLNLKRSNATEVQRGLVMIQIDGLSRTQLNKALEIGEMPFLKNLINKQQYKIHPLYTGLPSSTPAVQGELFYRVKQIVPAFAFFDSETGRIFRMYDSPAAVKVEDRLKNEAKVGGQEELLAQGSSYSNIYRGGAGESHFCAVKIGWDMLWRDVNPLRIVLLWITHFFDHLWTAFLMVVETAIATGDFLAGVLAGENLIKELKFIPTRTFICILLRDLVVMGAKMDIVRGLPVIHMNFLGYDEQAHRRGPSSRFAHKALKGIDNAIAKIYAQAIHSTRRDYDIWIYSDHGQEDTVSYVKRHGKTANAAVREVYREFMGFRHEKEDVPMGAQHGRTDESQDQKGMEMQRARYLGDRFTRWFFAMIGVRVGEGADAERQRPGDIVVTAIGPTGNIYLPSEMDPPEKERFARLLVEKANIPTVLIPEAGRKVLGINDQGMFRLPEGAKEIIGADHMYLEELTKDLIALCHHPEAGAFTFMGWQPGKEKITFPVENGSHAGPGTEETNAFALLPAGIIPNLDEPAFIRTNDIREAALKLLKRKNLAADTAETGPKFQLSGNDFNKNPVLRVMTYNVHSCIGVDGKISPERIARVIARHHPDIVALQELDLRRARTGGMDQPHIIAKELEMMYHFHPNIIVEEEHYGSAVLSRYPMEMVKAGDLPGLDHNQRLEPRGAMWCRIHCGGLTVQLFNSHLGLRRAERLFQVKALCGPEWLAHPACRGPVVLCGDFNALPRSVVHRQILRKLKDVQMSVKGHEPRATWISHFPLGRIDHIFVSPNIHVGSVIVPQTDLDKKSSDHLPLIVDLHFSTKSR